MTAILGLSAYYHDSAAALVVDGNEMRHYANGILELARPIDFRPPGAGRTSIGVRINRVHWYKGAIRQARFTAEVLSPEQFLAWPPLSAGLESPLPVGLPGGGVAAGSL